MFEYVMVLVSIIIGLAITHLLQGIARIVQHPGQHRLYWVHLVWVAWAFCAVITWWWWEFRFRSIETWTFQLYFFVLGYAFLNYLLCALLFPDDLDRYDGYETYFYSRRAWFFSLGAAYFAVDLVDTLAKGTAHFASFGLEYPLATGSMIVLCLFAAVSRNERFHAAFAVLMLAYQISWVLRYFDTMN
jgi:hypothetical protein